MGINDVLHKYDESAAKKAILVGEYNDGERDYVVIEAPPEGLRFIGELLMAHAEDSESICDWSMSPEGEGFGWFDDRSPKGLLIHRMPCEYGAMTLVEAE